MMIMGWVRRWWERKRYCTWSLVWASILAWQSSEAIAADWWCVWFLRWGVEVEDLAAVVAIWLFDWMWIVNKDPQVENKHLYTFLSRQKAFRYSNHLGASIVSNPPDSGSIHSKWVTFLQHEWKWKSKTAFRSLPCLWQMAWESHLRISSSIRTRINLIGQWQHGKGSYGRCFKHHQDPCSPITSRKGQNAKMPRYHVMVA